MRIQRVIVAVGLLCTLVVGAQAAGTADSATMGQNRIGTAGGN